jgi:hypothetical protein
MLRVTYLVNTGYLLCATFPSYAAVELLKRPFISSNACKIFDNLAFVSITTVVRWLRKFTCSTGSPSSLLTIPPPIAAKIRKTLLLFPCPCPDACVSISGRERKIAHGNLLAHQRRTKFHQHTPRCVFLVGETWR